MLTRHGCLAAVCCRFINCCSGVKCPMRNRTANSGTNYAAAQRLPMMQRQQQQLRQQQHPRLLMVSSSICRATVVLCRQPLLSCCVVYTAPGTSQWKCVFYCLCRSWDWLIALCIWLGRLTAPAPAFGWAAGPSVCLYVQVALQPHACACSCVKTCYGSGTHVIAVVQHRVAEHRGAAGGLLNSMALFLSVICWRGC
jgi:hypothetical protein